MLVNELFEFIKKYLDKNNIKSYDKNDLYIILEYVFKVDINKLYMGNFEVYVTKYKLEKLKNALKSYYIDFIPLAYITKFQKFYNEIYYINENVLVPRYDTEILVDYAIKYIKKYNLKNAIDMCTGSGCIGISISKNSNVESCILVDISKPALKVAKKNIKLNMIENKCKILNSDLFNKVNKKTKYSIIVSNPPYIKLRDKKLLSKYVNKEPELALYGGNDGMIFYKRILDEAYKYLINDAIIIFEIGYDEKEDIKKLISKYKFYDIIEFVKDYGNNDRVVVCRFHQI